MRTCAYHARVALAFSVSSEKLICSYNAISRAVYALETGCSIPGSCCKQLIILFAEPHGPGMDAVITLHQEGNETNRGVLTMPMSGIELFNTTNYSLRPDCATEVSHVHQLLAGVKCRASTTLLARQQNSQTTRWHLLGCMRRRLCLHSHSQLTGFAALLPCSDELLHRHSVLDAGDRMTALPTPATHQTPGRPCSPSHGQPPSRCTPATLPLDQLALHIQSSCL